MNSIIELIKLNYPVNGEEFEGLKGRPIKVDPHGGYMRLCVEYVGKGPRGMDTISVAHYYEQNGDLCSDPEMTFEVPWELWTTAKWWAPTSFAMSGSGIYRECVWLADGKVKSNVAQVRDNMSFMKTWDRNIKEQGFITRFKSKCAKLHA